MVSAGPFPVAIVTGGAKRIGRAVVEDLADHGWAVAIHVHRSVDEGEALAANVRSAGGRAATVQADLADLAGASRILPEVVARLGPPTLLVNSAAIFEKDSVETLETDLWQRQMTINFASPVFLARAFAAALPEGAEGNVVNVVDQRVIKPTPLNLSYQLSKSALWKATEVLAQALAPRIRVNAIAPGPALPSAHRSDEEFRRLTRSVILGRGPDLAEFGRTIRFLVETRSITGQTIALDGGQHLAWKTPDVTVLG